MSSQRRQMMQPWPLCIMPFAKPKERSVLPKYYTRVPSITRSSTASSNIASDCASNATISTSVSPFNSQTALITDKKAQKQLSQKQAHYYAENLKSAKPTTLSGARIYDPISKENREYRLFDPLLAKDEVCVGSTRALMDSQDTKPGKETEMVTLPPPEYQKVLRPTRLRFMTQVIAALSVSLGSLVVGYSTSYTSTALVSMQNSTSFTIDNNMSTWIASIMPLCGLFGGIIGGPFIEYFGRRNTILATAPPFVISWLLISQAVNYPMILCGRALSGLCVGIASLALPVYLGETIQTEVRGTLGLMPTVFGNTGILACFTVGMYLDWRNLALFGACLPVPFLVLMFLIPETPRWYISKGKTKKAREALQWLRGKEADITEELTVIEKIHVDAERNSSGHALLELCKKSHLKPLLISLGLMFFQQMSGINAVMFYTVEIFQAAGSTVDKNISTIIVGIVNFISTFVAAALIDRLGRKMLLYISSLTMCLMLISLGVFFYVKSIGTNVDTIGWIPLVSLMTYVIGFSVGFGPIPWLMMGEILPAKVRGSAASVATGFNWTCTFIVTKTFKNISNGIGSYGAFWVYGLTCFTAFFFVLLMVPETRGKSLEEIEKRFTGPTRRLSAVANMRPMPMSV